MATRDPYASPEAELADEKPTAPRDWLGIVLATLLPTASVPTFVFVASGLMRKPVPTFVAAPGFLLTLLACSVASAWALTPLQRRPWLYLLATCVAAASLLLVVVLLLKLIAG